MKTHIARAGARGGMLVALASACIWSCGTSGGSASPASSGSDNSGTGGTSAAGSSATASGAGSGVSSGTGTGGSSTGGSGSSVSSVGSSSGTGGSAASSGATTVAGGDGGSTGSSGSSSGSPSSSGSTGTAPSGAVAFDSSRVVVTGLRGLATPAAKSMVNLHNGGSTAVTVTKLAFGGTTSLAANKTGGGAEYSMQTPTGQTLFQTSTTLPATIMPGADLAIAVQMTTSGATLPAAPDPGANGHYDSGCNLFTDTLTATLSAGSAVASVYGLLLEPDSAVAAPPGGFSAFTSGYEATLGQILTTLGYQVNVGAAQTSWNPNSAMVATMLSISNPPAPNEITTAGGSLFVKAGAGMVTITVVARFSPQGSLPFGWYTPGAGTPMTTTVGTMQLQSDPQTSDLARIVYPPLTGTVSTGAAGSTKTFDPGSGSFGIWMYSDQMTQKFDEGGTKTNGDYDYSEDSLNSPANVHRVKVFPLADATGTAIPQSYLVAVEEASNGDYQDYVFVLSNVNLAP
jgi:hypothetical protein